MFYDYDLPNVLTHGTSEADQKKDLALKRKNVVGKSFKVGIALSEGGQPVLLGGTIRIESLDKQHDDDMLDTMGK